jgi:tetratricopeptide (TPR) repeat protein
VELNPEFGKALVWRGVQLACVGDWDRAVTFATQAVTIAPDSEYVRTVRAMVLNWTRRFDEALAELDAILERAPHSVLALYSRGLAHVGRGQPGEGLHDLELAASLSSRATFVLSFLGTARAQAGDREGARQLLEEIGDESRVDPDPRWTAAIYYALGDLDRAFELLEEGIDLKLCGMYVFPAWPIWGEDYSDPRWAEFFEAIGVTWPMLPA